MITKNQPFWVPTPKGPIKHAAKDRVKMSSSYHYISGPFHFNAQLPPKAAYKLTCTSNLADKSSNLVPKSNIAVKKGLWIYKI